MAKLLDTILYTKGDRLLCEGEPGDCAYMITSGEVEIVKRNRFGEEILIARLGPGEMVGEMCLFAGNTLRSASAVAFTDRVEVVKISKEGFDQHINALPHGVRQAIHVLIHRLQKADLRITLLS